MTTPDAELLDIGEVIARSGLPASTLHLWERSGLIASAERVGLRRQYDAEVLTRIALIVVSKRAGFSLAEISELFAPDAFADGKALLEIKLIELRRRRAELDAAIDGIEHALACTAASPLECNNFTATLTDVLPIVS